MMYVRPLVVRFWWWALACALCCFSVTSQADTVGTGAATHLSWSSSPSGTKFSFGASGSPINVNDLSDLVGKSKPAFGANTAALSTAIANDGGAAFKALLDMPVGGASVPVTAEAAIAKPSMGKALARFGMRMAFPLQAGMAIFELYKELGLNCYFSTAKNAQECNKTVDSNDGSVCYRDAWEPWITAYDTCGSTKESACQKFVGRSLASWGIIDSANVVQSGGAFVCETHGRYNQGGTGSWSFEGYVKSTSTSTTTPVTEQDVADMIAQKSGWPTGSAVTKALRDAINAGEKVDTVGAPKVSGPSTVVGPKESSVGTDGKSVTNDVNYKCQYLDDTVTCNKETVTTTTTTGTTTTPTGGTTTTTTTTTSTSTGPVTPATEYPDLCKEHPDIIACRTLGDAPTPDTLSKTQHAVEVVATTFAGSAACPQPITFSALGHSYAIPYTPLCEALAKIRYLIVALASIAAAWVLADSFRLT